MDYVFAWALIISNGSYTLDVLYFYDYESCENAVEFLEGEREYTLNLAPRPTQKCIPLSVDAPYNSQQKISKKSTD